MIGTKKGMTSKYDSRGRRVGATIVELGPNFITQIKTTETKDGYNAVQLGFGVKKSQKKPMLGQLKKAGVSQVVKYVKEVKANDLADVTLGQEVKIKDIFTKGDSVKVTGISKGRGFQGGVKRYNFRGGPKTHGQSDRHRAPGSSGSGTTPGRVFKGKRMAGHMGVDQFSYTGVEVLEVDKTNNLIVVKGGVPGPIGGLITIEKQGRIKGYIAPPEPEPEEEEVKEEMVETKEEMATPEAADVTEPVENATSEDVAENVEEAK